MLVSLFLLALAPAAGAETCPAPKANPNEADLAKAKEHMDAGVAFVRDPDGARYEEAYPEFRKAYELSGSLNALQNLGTCAMKLELDGEAIGCFRRFLTKKGTDIDPQDKAQVEKDLAALDASVAWVTFSSDRPNVRVVDVRTPRRGQVVRSIYTIGIEVLTLGVHPGSHEVVASSDGFPDQKWTIEIANGSKHNKEFVFEPNKPVTPLDTPKDPVVTPPGDDTPKDTVVTPPDEDKPPVVDEDSSRPIPAYVYIAGGGTLAAGAVGGLFAGLASSKGSEYETDLHGKAPIAEQEEARDEIKTKNLIADVMFGVAGAGAVTTVVLFLMRPEATVEEEAKASTAGGFGRDWTVAPIVGHEAGGVSLLATF